MENQASAALTALTNLVTTIGFFLLFLAILAGLVFLLMQWWKHRGREQYALDFVTLQIRLPRDNEIKIDAAEQMFAGLYSLKKSGFGADWFKKEDFFAFEIVALKEDIGFYISCPRVIRDLVEKQINGAYPTEEMKEVEEINIFSEKGKVAFASLSLENANYFPIKTYKDLPTDGLSLITSGLAKMDYGEGAIIQLLLQPIGNSWKEKARSFVSSEKKREADPEKATYSHDPKQMESITNKTEKNAFRVAMRIVVSAPNDHLAESHLNNIMGAFAQFSSAYNSFHRTTIFLKHFFMIDFLYRYMPFLNRGTSILNTEELATILHLPNKTVETPHIKWLNAKNAPAPSNIPNEGLFLGNSKYRGVERKVYM